MDKISAAAKETIGCGRVFLYLTAALAGVLSACGGNVLAQTVAGPVSSQAGGVQAAASGQILGTVQDLDEAEIAGAKILLIVDGQPDRVAFSDISGGFQFDRIPAGRFRLAVTKAGFADANVLASLAEGERLDLPSIVLDAAAEFSVNAISVQQAAEIQIHAEEKQRILGILPNFYVVYSGPQIPLSAGQKLRLEVRAITDPVNFAITGIIAGVQQANNTYAFGKDAMGFAQRYAVDYANGTTSAVLGGGVFPILFHQDPRYFYKGTGSKKSRILYALSTAVRQKSDTGKWQFAYSSILGDAAAASLSNLYVPAANRNGAGLTVANFGLNVASDGISNIVQEMVFNHLTTKKAP